MKNNQKSRVAWTGVIAIAGFAIVGWKAGPEHEKLEDAARNFDACFNKGDAGCLLNYMHEEERKNLSLTKDRLSALMRQYVSEQLKGFKPSGELTLTKHDEPLYVTTSRKWTHTDGRSVTWEFDFYATEEGPRVMPFTNGLLYFPAKARLEPGLPYPVGSEKLKLMDAQLAYAMPIWQRIGLNRYAVSKTLSDTQTPGVFRYRTFEQARTGFRQGLATISPPPR